jgi:hypothetical protein
MELDLAAWAGVYNIGFAVFHLSFRRLFRWAEELPRLSRVNRGIVPALNLALAFMFMMVGTLMLVAPSAELLAGTTLFWIFRAAIQPLYFGLRHRASAAMFVLFLVGVALHGAAWWSI